VEASEIHSGDCSTLGALWFPPTNHSDPIVDVHSLPSKSGAPRWLHSRGGFTEAWVAVSGVPSGHQYEQWAPEGEKGRGGSHDMKGGSRRHRSNPVDALVALRPATLWPRVWQRRTSASALIVSSSAINPIDRGPGLGQAPAWHCEAFPSGSDASETAPLVASGGIVDACRHLCHNHRGCSI